MGWKVVGCLCLFVVGRERRGRGKEVVMVRGMGIVMGKGGLFMDDGVEIVNRALF